MTTIQRIVQLFGWIFIVIAVWGAVLTGTSMNPEPATAPRLWGLFPINFLHNLVHLVLGMWAVVAARSYSGARSYALLAGALYIVLAVLGVFSPHGFGLVPLGGNDIWLHLVLGAILLVTGLIVTSRSSSSKVEPAPIRTVMPPGGARRESTTEPDPDMEPRPSIEPGMPGPQKRHPPIDGEPSS